MLAIYFRPKSVVQIALWVGPLLLLTVSCATLDDDFERFATASVASHSRETAKIRFEVKTQPTSSYVISVRRDENVSFGTTPDKVGLIGDFSGASAVLVDAYPSSTSDASNCHAGQERYLRVLSISKKPSEEVFSMKIASCDDTVELAAPGVGWIPESRTVHIRWYLDAVWKVGPEAKVIQLGDKKN